MPYFTGLARYAREYPARVTLVRTHALTTAMFVGTVAWQFVYVSLPFHIQAISPYDSIR